MTKQRRMRTITITTIDGTVVRVRTDARDVGFFTRQRWMLCDGQLVPAGTDNK